MSPTARKVARLIGELDSVSRRLKNLIPDLQTLDFESRALKAAKAGRLPREQEDLPDILTYESTGIGRP